MLARAYLFGSVLLIAGYAAAEWLGWEFGDPVRVRAAPPVGAAVARGWGGGSSTYRSHSYSSGTRSGVGGGGLGGK